MSLVLSALLMIAPPLAPAPAPEKPAVAKPMKPHKPHGKGLLAKLKAKMHKPAKPADAPKPAK